MDRGYSVIPIGAGQKWPGKYFATGDCRRPDCPDGGHPHWHPMTDWNQYVLRVASDFEVQLWETWPGCGIGVPLGETSGIVAIDFDNNVGGLHEKILDMIPESPVKKVGKLGFTAFYRYNGEKGGKWNIGGQSVVELLSGGRQTVLPPSVHPDGNLYRWISNKTLSDVDPGDLPQLPEDFEEKLNKLFGRNNDVRPTSNISEAFYGSPTVEKIESALKYIDSDDYHVWVEVGMAIKTELNDAGFSVWDKWSSNSAKYKPKGMWGKWKSFRRHDKTIASIFYHAQEKGWIAPPPPHDPLNEVRILPGGNLLPNVPSGTFQAESTQNEPKISRTGHLEKLIQDAPGVVGDIIRWVDETAVYPQPILALAAVLPMMGVVRGHRVQTETGLRTNLYTMGVASSGAGKEHARQCVQRLLLASGQEKLLGGTPASSAGLFKAVLDGNGRRLVLMDEFGKTLKTMTGKNAAAHSAGIPTLMMMLFSQAAGMFQGAEYANSDGKRDRQDIEQPCLGVYATTVPGHLYESMSSSDAIDGFLSRWLVFQTDEIPLDGLPGGSIEIPPEGILDQLKYWKDQPTNRYPKGNLDADLGIRPEIIKFSASAEILAQAFRRDMRKRMIDEAHKKTGIDAIYARVDEHARKIALTIFEGPMISKEVFEWSAAVALDRAEFLIGAIHEHVSDTEYEAQLKRISGIIREAGTKGIAQNDITRRTQRIPPKRRTEILTALMEGDQATWNNENTAGRDRRIWFWLG